MTEKFVRNQLGILKQVVTESSLESARRYQNLIGELMALSSRSDVSFSRREFPNFDGEWITPQRESCGGVILYLHGGGYTCGELEYTRGFGSKLSARLGIKVFCCAYRLAPENPFPAALEDALESYRFLLQSGFTSDRIVLAGESAGGGLCYSLMIRLRELGMDMPAGVIAISPWTDLTMSGESYQKNAEVDPSMTVKRLEMFAECYCEQRKSPLVSPIFFEGVSFPPSLILVGGDEIMLDDSVNMHKRLLRGGSRSKLVVAPGLWHAYVLYDLKERRQDYTEIAKFISGVMPPSSPLWARLDNAAKIFPASRRRGWYNMFRLSLELDQPVDPVLLQEALDVTAKRFPMIAARLKTGVFWYYLEEVKSPPAVQPEYCHPLKLDSFDSMRKCAVRVLYYKKRIAVEFFHAVTDGTGGLIFLKTLAAEYLERREGISIPCEKGVLDRLAYPDPGELEDSFLKNIGEVSAKRSQGRSFRLDGIPEDDGFLHITVGKLSLEELHSMAKGYGVTITGLLAAVMLMSILELQAKKVPARKNRRPVRIQIPVNLRKLFGGHTLRNFVMVVNVGIDPRMGEHSFDEVVNTVKHQLALFVTKKHMQSVFTTNVRSESSLAIRMVPLFIKNMIMKAVFDSVGEAQACLSLSNLGALELPKEMDEHVTGFDFIIGPQAAAPYNCGVCSYKDELRINIIRRSTEPELEREFFTRLVRLGLRVRIESNQRSELAD